MPIRTTSIKIPAPDFRRFFNSGNYFANNAFCTGAGNIITGDGTSHPHGYTFSLTQPLFEGFQNLNAIQGAKSTVREARESLRTVEQPVVLDATTAYVDVVRDTAIGEIAREQREAL